LKRPRIAVDARILSESLTGIGRYTLEILKRLVENQEIDWFLYSHKPIIIGSWQKPNVYLNTLNLNGRIFRMIWAQTVLPYMVNSDNIDLFWSPAHRIPTFLSKSIFKVVTIHDLVWKYAGYTMRPSSRLLDMLLMPLAIKSADWVFCVSESTKRDVINLIPSSLHKVSITSNAAVFSELSGSRMIHSNISYLFNKDYFLFVGTHEPRKNLARLFEAISLLPTQTKFKMKLYVVGGTGWGGVRIDKLITQYNLDGIVESLGYVSEPTLYGLYKHAKFLVMPSLYEGFGLPIVEAMHFGVPILTSNISSMPEIAEDSAILVDPNSVKSISNGLSSLIEDRELRKRLSKNGLERAQFYSWDKTTKHIEEIFINAVKNR
jgi:glycosyltransferase involved in cell wall biosynthesis